MLRTLTTRADAGFLDRLSYTALLTAALFAAACSGSGGGAPAGAPGGGRGGGVPVDAVTLAPKPIEDTTEFVGVLKSRRSSLIQPQAEGFIKRILVKSGDRVTTGAAMFEIDASTQQAAVASLESTRAAREADAAFAKQQADRSKALLGVGAMSQQEYELAVTQQRTAEANLKAVSDQIRQQQAELAYYTVSAPGAGVVGDVPVRVGDRVTKATQLTTVDDNAGLEVYINVPVSQASRLRVGLPVRLMSDTNDVLVSERINYVSASVDDTTQTVLVKTPLNARPGQFRSDQSVRALIVFDTKAGITAPLVAVTRVNGQYFVFVAEAAGGGATVAHQRAVELGPVVGNEYVVLSGLKAGEKLIVGGIQKIGDGAPVMFLPPAGAAPPAASPAKPAGEGGR